MLPPVRRFKAGDTIEDICRACKVDRMHTVVAADADGTPLRVVVRLLPAASTTTAAARGSTCWPRASARRRRRGAATGADRGRRQTRSRSSAIAKGLARPCHDPADAADLELLLRRIIREETGLTPVAPAEKWRGGTLVLRPGQAGPAGEELADRDLLPQGRDAAQPAAHARAAGERRDLPDDVKVKLQGYITGCYGSLTSFNVLFADEDDQFKGAGD